MSNRFLKLIPISIEIQNMSFSVDKRVGFELLGFLQSISMVYRFQYAMQD